jgi:hypothetical protein
MTDLSAAHTQTAANVTDAFCKLLIAKQGHAYATGYITSLLLNVVAYRLSEDQQAEFAADISKRLSEEVGKMT